MVGNHIKFKFTDEQMWLDLAGSRSEPAIWDGELEETERLTH
jgi:hypothetical protein